MNRTSDMLLAPSRHSNPFATCWTRPGALEFQFPPGASVTALNAQLAAANWRGEIVGPHGSGKSTLLATLLPHLTAAGFNVATIGLRDGERRLPINFVRDSLAVPRPLLVIDGYEQLSWFGRRVLLLRCRRAAAGLVVTAHHSVGLPLLYRTQPSLTLAEQLVSTLTVVNPSPISRADIAASHACHGSNLRELFFTLYDRHEALASARRRSARTAARMST
jgi:hypothetical protein